jgi:NMD protein affecting ribosome stability and mRNA decay
MNKVLINCSHCGKSIDASVSLDLPNNKDLCQDCWYQLATEEGILLDLISLGDSVYEGTQESL